MRTQEFPTWKRALDLMCCTLALPILALLTLALEVSAWAASPGPVMFRQERVGYMGRRFRVWKFRTMHLADESRKVSHRRSSTREIPGAWWLRASGLDELPQLINVLRGEMSIVGPRPATPAEFEWYSAQHRERFTTLPGLSGVSQIAGMNRSTLDEITRLDIKYAQSRSLWLDLRIIALTFPVLVRQISDERRVRASIALSVADGHSQSAR